MWTTSVGSNGKVHEVSNEPTDHLNHVLMVKSNVSEFIIFTAALDGCGHIRYFNFRPFRKRSAFV